jgi:hypothetical protein
LTDELIIVNAVVYAGLALGLVAKLSLRQKVKGGAGTIYSRLESSLKRRFPDLPAGFTLREGLERARRFAPGLDWHQLGEELRSYELHRYGADTAPANRSSETARLVRLLGGRWG